VFDYNALVPHEDFDVHDDDEAEVYVVIEGYSTLFNHLKIL